MRRVQSIVGGNHSSESFFDLRVQFSLRTTRYTRYRNREYFWIRWPSNSEWHTACEWNDATRTVKFAWQQIWCPLVRHRQGAKKGTGWWFGVHSSCCQNVQSDQPVWNTGTLYTISCTAVGKSLQFKWRRRTHIVVRVCIECRGI
jgi:hypothetical protein